MIMKMIISLICATSGFNNIKLLYVIKCLSLFVCFRWQADGPDRRLRWSLWRGCGLSGGSGLNALRPAARASHRGAGSVYLLRPLRPLHSPTLHLTGQVIYPGASEVLSSHLCVPTTLPVTPGNTHLITLLPSPPITTQDCRCIEIPMLLEEEEEEEEEELLLYQDRPIRQLLSTSRNSPQPIKTAYLFFDLPTTLLHTATTSHHGSSGGQPILEQWGLEEAGIEGRSRPVGTVCLRGGECARIIRE